MEVEPGSLSFNTVLAPLGVTHTLVGSSAGPLLSPGLCGSQGAREQGAGPGTGEAKKPRTPGEALPPSPPLPASPGPTPPFPSPHSFPPSPLTRHAPPSFSSSPQGPPGARPHPSAPAFAPSTGVARLSPPLRPAGGCPLQGLGSRCMALPPEEQLGSSLVVQWFELGAFTGMCLGLTPGLRTEL